MREWTKDPKALHVLRHARLVSVDDTERAWWGVLYFDNTSKILRRWGLRYAVGFPTPRGDRRHVNINACKLVGDNGHRIQMSPNIARALVMAAYPQWVPPDGEQIYGDEE